MACLLGKQHLYLFYYKESIRYSKKSPESQLAKLATHGSISRFTVCFYPTITAHAIHIFGLVIHRNSKRQICMHFYCSSTVVNK